MGELKIVKDFEFNGSQCGELSGIYRFDIGKHFYIGSAKVIKRRWKEHITLFKKNKHHSNFAQNAFNRYKSIVFSIVELCGEDNITQREQYWIDTLSPDLNMTAVADNHWRLSEETIAKRTEKQVKTIYQYGLDGNLIKEWESVKQAGETLGINRPSISNCLKGRYKSAGGYIWRYSKEEVTPVRRNKSIEQYNLNGTLVKVWDSINVIENETNYKRKTIYACANGQNSTAYGYIWKYTSCL